MRAVLCVVTVVAAGSGLVVGCGGSGLKVDGKLANACTSDNADPNACLAIAEERLAKGDEDTAREYMDKLVVAINAAPACLRDHAPRGCFAGVIALLHDKPVGLLAPYEIPRALLDIVPRWTGSEATGRRVQARIALHGMCVVAGSDAVEQQRACLVLGDLVEDERFKRCGAGCDVKASSAQLSGWSLTDVIDGYAAACKVDTKRVSPAKASAFAKELAATYNVTGNNAACTIATSPLRGASIPEALASMKRIREEAQRRESSTTAAAKREAERLAAMEKQKADNAAAAAKAEAEAFRKGMLDAIPRADWSTTFGLLTKHRGVAIDDAVAAALQRTWPSFSTWVIGQSSSIAAYFDLSARLAMVPPNHAVRQSLATLRDTALADAKKAARNARGPGGAWLHAAILAKIAGPKTPEAEKAAAAFAKLTGAVRVSLTIDNPAPACAPLIKAPPPGRTIRAKSTLACTLEPERKTTTKEPFKVMTHVVDEAGERDVEQETVIEVTHRTFKVVVHGSLTITRGAPVREVPIDVDVIVDDTDGSDGRTFDTVRAATIELIRKSVVAPIEDADAQKAHTAGTKALAANRAGAAENHFVTHAILTGASSAELDQLMTGYGVTFAELLP